MQPEDSKSTKQQVGDAVSSGEQVRCFPFYLLSFTLLNCSLTRYVVVCQDQRSLLDKARDAVGL